MTATEVDLRPQAQPTAIPAKIAYARALAESGLLPDSYRGRPANILWAAEYGEMLGLSTMAAITGVHVIKGKPTASAGLISALVRRAGHKLRVRGDAKSATCQIIRSDDPKYTFEVTFTIDDAKTAELLDKDNWKHFAPSMLKARAITQCARDACEEALFGLHYTPEELGAVVDEDGVVVDGEPQQAAARSDGTPPDDQWYVRPAPAPAPEYVWPGVDQACKDAASFTTDAAYGEIWRAAAAAAKAGLCGPDQATLVQNILRKHHAKLKAAATPVDVEDLGRQAAEADPTRPAAPAATSTGTGSSTAPAADGHSDAPEDKPGSANSDQLTALHITLGGLGFGRDDRDAKLKLAETIAGRELTGPHFPGRTSKNLSYNEARRLTDTLDGFGGDRDKLIAHMATLEQDGDSDA